MEYPDAPGPAWPPFGLSFRKGTIMQIRFIPAASALALAVCACLSASQSATAQQTTAAKLYIDVATHAMPGAPGMGAIGLQAGAMGDETSGSYGMARHPGMPGKYLDVALHNSRQPGAPASQAVPSNLGLGKHLQLLAPGTNKSSHGGGDTKQPGTNDQADGKIRIRHYWGCGEQLRTGQPAELSLTVRGGKTVTSGRMAQPRKVPVDDIHPGPQYALWPNPSARKRVGAKASLAGTHQVTAAGLPETMAFELGRDHDFMPELKLKSDGDAGGGMNLQWNGVDGALGYFAHATAMEGDTIVMWSSSEDGYAGPELMSYLPDSLVTQWIGKRTLMKAEARNCRIPPGVFANAGKGGGPMVQMIAYGSERALAQSRPADAPRDWRPAWSVRVRNKSTAMLMPGLAAAGGPETTREAAEPAVKGAAKSLLRGLLGR